MEHDRVTVACCVLPQIIVSVAEHHSVIVPMQMLAQRTGATLRHVGLTPDQRVDLEVHFRPHPVAQPSPEYACV